MASQPVHGQRRSHNCDKHDSDLLTHAVHSPPCPNLYIRQYCIRSQCTRRIWTAGGRVDLIHSPYLQPSVQPPARCRRMSPGSKARYTQPVFTACEHGCQKWHPCSRAVLVTNVSNTAVNTGVIFSGNVTHF